MAAIADLLGRQRAAAITGLGSPAAAAAMRAMAGATNRQPDPQAAVEPLSTAEVEFELGRQKTC